MTANDPARRLGVQAPVLPSLTHFLTGVVLLSTPVALACLALSPSAGLSVPSHVAGLLVVLTFSVCAAMYLGPAHCFGRGPRLAWDEKARVSRWLNVTGLAVYLGLLLGSAIGLPRGGVPWGHHVWGGG